LSIYTIVALGFGSMNHSCPDYNSLILMSDIDRMPKPWRMLVHEYGYKLVSSLRDNGFSLQDARDACWLQRAGRQAEWLSTDYITKKAARNYF